MTHFKPRIMTVVELGLADPLLNGQSTFRTTLDWTCLIQFRIFVSVHLRAFVGFGSPHILLDLTWTISHPR